MGDLLKKLLSSVTGKKRSSQGLPTALIFSGLIAMLSALYSIKLTLARRKIGKLQHKLDVQKEEEQHNRVLKDIVQREALRKKIGEQIKEGKTKVKELRGDIVKSKNDVKVFKAALKEAKAWSQIKVI